MSLGQRCLWGRNWIFIYYLDELQGSEGLGTLIFFEAFSVLVLQHLLTHYTVPETEIAMN
jgi:hypothetical protein